MLYLEVPIATRTKEFIMITLPNPFIQNHNANYDVCDELTVTYAKYHGHSYRVQMDPTDPLHIRSVVAWQPAFGESRHALSMEQACGLHLISTIVQTAYNNLNVAAGATPIERLRSNLLAMESEAIKQRVYWIERPDLSQLWNFLPCGVIGEIFSYLDQHEVLQLRCVCQTWRGADELLWKVWLGVRRVFFPQQAARKCKSIVEYRRSKEGYLGKRKRCKGVSSERETYERWGRDLLVTDTHILRCDTNNITRIKHRPKRVRVVERQSSKTILTDSCPTEPTPYADVSYPGWFFTDDLVVGSDFKKCKLKIYELTSGKLIQNFKTRRQYIRCVRRESQQIIATISEGKLLQRWNLQTGKLESTLHLSGLEGGDYANARCASWEGDLILFFGDRESCLVDISQPDRLLAILPHSCSLLCYGDAYLISGPSTFGLYVRTPDGKLDLCWSRKEVESVYLVGDTIIVQETLGSVNVLNPKTGETERTLFVRLYSGSSKVVCIEDDKLFIQHSFDYRLFTLYVIDIPSGEQLFHCTIPSEMHFVGARGDTLFVSDREGLYTCEPDL